MSGAAAAAATAPAADKPTTAGGFSDVPADSSYRLAIDWASGMKITSGTGDHLFGPDQICTRSQIVTFLYRAFNK